MSRIAATLALLLALLMASPSMLASALGDAPTAPSSAAEGEITWSVEPVPNADGQRRTFDYTVDPGTQVTDSVVISNRGQNSAEFTIYATDARNELETGAFGLLKKDETPIDSGAWIAMASDKLVIEPGTQAVVPFNLLVPSDATPGDHVAGIVASVLTTGTQDGAAVALEQRVGARVYLRVSGDPDVGVEASGLVTGFTPEVNPFAPGTVSVTYDVRNSGNIRMDVNQKILVTGPFGIPLGEATPDPVSNILPRQTVRVITRIPAVAALFLAWSSITLVPGEVGTAGQAVGDAPKTPAPGATPAPSAPAPDATAAAPGAAGDPSAAPADPAAAAPAAADAAVVDAPAALKFVPVSATSMSLAVSWTLLALVVLLAVIAFLVWRYVTGTRERLYAAIDEATELAKDGARSGGSSNGTRA